MVYSIAAARQTRAATADIGPGMRCTRGLIAMEIWLPTDVAILGDAGRACQVAIPAGQVELFAMGTAHGAPPAPSPFQETRTGVAA